MCFSWQTSLLDGSEERYPSLVFFFVLGLKSSQGVEVAILHSDILFFLHSFDFPLLGLGFNQQSLELNWVDGVDDVDKEFLVRSSFLSVVRQVLSDCSVVFHSLVDRTGSQVHIPRKVLNEVNVSELKVFL